MRNHTNNFKNQIKKLGRQINAKIYYYPNYNLITEDGKTILSENDIEIVSEQFDKNNATEIDSELIYSMDIIKNGQLLQSLMKELDLELKYELNIGSVVNAKFGLKISNYIQTTDVTYQNDKNYYILENDIYILLIKGIDYQVGNNVTGTKYNLDEEYEYLDYGNYVVYSKKFNLDTETWNYVCYDMMLYSMIKYKPSSSISYPITIRDFINIIANKMGIGFANSSDTFTNYDQLINEELFANKGYTLRDILDKLSQITASNILINDDDELEIGYINETNDTIDEEYLKNLNVAFGNNFGPINRISISDTDNNLEYYSEDSVSVKQNEMTQVNIVDNELAFNGEEQTIADNILTKLNGLYYSINDFETTGVCYYDYLDMFNVEAKDNEYKCLLLNNEIPISQGIKESIFTEELEDTETSSNNYETSIMTDKQVQFKINQQEGKIESKVEKDGVISAINQSAEEIQIQANKLSFEGATINMTADNVKIKGKNLDINSDGKITLEDNNAGALIQENAQASYIIKSENEDEYQGQFANVYFINKILSGGKINEYENNNEIEGTSGYGHYFGGVKEEIYRYPKTTWYMHSNDYAEGYNNGTYDGLSVSVNRILSTKLLNGVSSNPLNIGADGNITCVSVNPTSRKEMKKNFEKLINAKEILNKIDIYKYNFKNEKDDDKKSIGFVIGDGFNYSQEITSKNNDGVNLYSMVSVLWQVVKEQQEEIKELKEMIKNG